MNDRIDATRNGSSLAIGYGNPLRGDDGIGWHVAALLQARPDNMEIDTMSCQQLVPELAEKISRAGTVYFVDATQAGVPGEWRCKPIQPEPGASALGHVATPQTLLAMAQELFGASPEAYLLTVCGSCFEFSEELSAVVAASATSVAAEIEHRVIAANSESTSDGMGAASRARHARVQSDFSERSGS